MFQQRWLPTPSIIRFLFIAAAVLAAGTAAAADTAATADGSGPQKVAVYIGTYTGKLSKGIYRFELDLSTGRLNEGELAAEVTNPSFLAIHPDRPWLYAVGELGNFAGKKGGAVSAFTIDRKTGLLTLLNQQSSEGPGPCHVAVDRTGCNVLVANYSGGSVACLPIAEDGSLGKATCFVQHEGSSVDPRRQTGPHAHSINLDAAGRFAFVPDLGLDKIMVYQFDAEQGMLTPNQPAWVTVEPGSGPRHFAFHPSGRFAYVINEMGCTITAFTYRSQRGLLAPIQTVGTLPADFDGDNTTAEVDVHPSGKFLYGSNRGHDSIVAFAVDPETGKLSYIAHQSTQGKTPRNFSIDPTGAYMLAANQSTDNVVVFRIDQETGRLQPTGQSVTVGSPVCVTMLPLGR